MFTRVAGASVISAAWLAHARTIRKKLSAVFGVGIIGTITDEHHPYPRLGYATLRSRCSWRGATYLEP